MNTIIIENSPIWREKLVHHVKQQSSLKFVGAFESILQAYHIIQSETIDLIFVNLEMVGLKAIDFSKGQNKAPLIIFLQSNKAFSFNAENSIIVDILSDSLNTQRFQKAIDKAQKWFQNEEKEAFFFIRTKNSYIKLCYDEVCYIKAMENFVQIVSPKETFTQLVSMKKILLQLPSEQFIQVHRSFIVNVKQVISIEKDYVKIAIAEIPIGNFYKDALLKVLLNQKLILR